MDTLLEALVLSIVLGLTGLIVLITGRFIRRNILFGTFVPEKHLDDQILKEMIRRFRIRVILTAGIAVAVNLLFLLLLQQEYLKMMAFVFITILMIVVDLWFYKSSYDHMQHLKAVNHWMDDVKVVRATDTTARQTMPHLPNVLYIIPAMILTGAIVIVALNYHNIPERIAVHWNIYNEPDRWEDKSFWTVYSMGLLGYGLTAFMLLAGNAINYLPMQLNPAAKDASINYEKSVRKNNSYMMFFISVVLSLMFSFIMLQPVLFDAGYMPPYVLPIMIVGMFIPIAISLYLQIKADSKYRNAAAENDKSPYYDDSHYKWGMFYYNKQDPNVWVPKISQFGMTLNFARPTAIWLTIGLLLLIFLPLIIALVMSNS